MSQVIFLLVSQCDLMTTFAIVICQKKVRPLVAVALVAPVTPRMCKKDALEKVIDGFMRTSVMCSPATVCWPSESKMP